MKKMKRTLSLLLCLCVLSAVCPMTLLASAGGGHAISDTLYDESGVIDDSNLDWIEEEDSPLAEEPLEDEPDLYDNQSFDDENAAQLSGERVPGQILIKFKDPNQVPGKEKQLQNEINKMEKIGFVEGLGVYVVALDDLEKNPNAILNRLKNNKYIEYVEPNYTLEATDTLEPLGEAAYKRYMSVTSQIINSPAGWDMFAPSGGDSSVIIAVIDSGVVQHSSLPKLLNGYSAVAGLSPNNDVMSHGTSVAGVIGAKGGEGKGVAGINWNASILPVKVDDNKGTMTTANVAKGIIWAADNGAKIINLSLGGTSTSITEKNALEYAYNKGCAIFAGAGNSGVSPLLYPAAYSSSPNLSPNPSKIMAIGSTNDGATKTATSNYGPGVDVLASGGYYTTLAAGTMANVSGTSIATPQVAGLASLIWALNPNLTNVQVYDLIRQNAKTLGGGYNAQTGYGVIDIGKTLEAVKAGAGTTATPDPEPIPEPKPNPIITLAGFSEVSMFVNASYKEDGYHAADYAGTDITEKVQVTNNVNTKTAGLYTINYKVTDDYGGSASMTRTVKVEPAPAPAPPQVPTITANGSGTLVLHIGGTQYMEQGVRAIDFDGTNISDQVIVSGTPDTTKAGTYTVNYRVTGKSGEVATTTRTVQVLAPAETVVRKPYSFNSQAKQGAVITHTSIVADQTGWMDLKVNSIDKNMTIVVDFIDSASKQVIFTDTLSAAGMKQHQINAGAYEMKVTVRQANGNSKYDIGLLMPEMKTTSFAQDEVPLVEFDTGFMNTTMEIIMLASIVSVLAYAFGHSFVQLRRTRRR